MSSLTDARITVKIFIGFLITRELRLLLEQSHLWKQAKIMHNNSSDELIETHHQGKDYIGLFTSKEKITLNELKDFQAMTAEKIKRYCPHYNQESVSPIIFPQVFIS